MIKLRTGITSWQLLQSCLPIICETEETLGRYCDDILEGIVCPSHLTCNTNYPAPEWSVLKFTVRNTVGTIDRILTLLPLFFPKDMDSILKVVLRIRYSLSEVLEEIEPYEGSDEFSRLSFIEWCKEKIEAHDQKILDLTKKYYASFDLMTDFKVLTYSRMVFVCVLFPYTYNHFKIKRLEESKDV